MKISIINLQLDVYYTIGDLVMVYYPMKDDSGKLKKLSRPWHGPYTELSVHPFLLPKFTFTMEN